MKRLGIELTVQGVMVLLVAGLAGFTALITAVPIGGAAFGIAPEQHLNLVSGLMCPAGSQVVFEEGGQVVTNSGDGPSYGTAINVMCEDASGVRTPAGGDALIAPMFGAIGVVLGGYFLACFAPLFLLGVIFGAFVTHKLVAGFMDKRPAPAQKTVL